MQPRLLVTMFQRLTLAPATLSQSLNLWDSPSRRLVSSSKMWTPVDRLFRCLPLPELWCPRRVVCSPHSLPRCRILSFSSHRMQDSTCQPSTTLQIKLSQLNHRIHLAASSPRPGQTSRTKLWTPNNLATLSNKSRTTSLSSEVTPKVPS